MDNSLRRYDDAEGAATKMTASARVARPPLAMSGRLTPTQPFRDSPRMHGAIASAPKSSTSDGETRSAETSAVARQNPVTPSSAIGAPRGAQVCSAPAAAIAAQPQVPAPEAPRMHAGCMPPRVAHSEHGRCDVALPIDARSLTTAHSAPPESAQSLDVRQTSGAATDAPQVQRLSIGSQPNPASAGHAPHAPSFEPPAPTPSNCSGSAAQVSDAVHTR